MWPFKKRSIRDCFSDDEGPAPCGDDIEPPPPAPPPRPVVLKLCALLEADDYTTKCEAGRFETYTFAFESKLDAEIILLYDYPLAPVLCLGGKYFNLIVSEEEAIRKSIKSVWARRSKERAVADNIVYDAAIEKIMAYTPIDRSGEQTPPKTP